MENGNYLRTRTKQRQELDLTRYESTQPCPVDSKDQSTSLSSSREEGSERRGGDELLKTEDRARCVHVDQ